MSTAPIPGRFPTVDATLREGSDFGVQEGVPSLSAAGWHPHGSLARLIVCVVLVGCHVGDNQSLIGVQARFACLGAWPGLFKPYTVDYSIPHSSLRSKPKPQKQTLTPELQIQISGFSAFGLSLGLLCVVSVMGILDSYIQKRGKNGLMHT